MGKILTWLVIALGIGALATGAAMAGAKYQGEHDMSGTITSIDHQTGKLSLQTGAGEMSLHFPPSALKDLKEGDQMTVHLGFTKGGAAGGTQQKMRR